MLSPVTNNSKVCLTSCLHYTSHLGQQGALLPGVHQVPKVMETLSQPCTPSHSGSMKER